MPAPMTSAARVAQRAVESRLVTSDPGSDQLVEGGCVRKRISGFMPYLNGVADRPRMIPTGVA